jgi:hypothetical protein
MSVVYDNRRKDVRAMLESIALAAALVLVLAVSSVALESDVYQMREDFDTEPLYDCALQYYYHVPSPYYSWYWVLVDWRPGDVLGKWFQIGDMPTGSWSTCDPVDCHVVEQIRVLDFAGYGCSHPGLFTVEFEVFCSDEYGCPVGPPLGSSGPCETCFGWNYVPLDPPITICGCATNPGPPPSAPRILVTVTHTGPDGMYPAWGLDNVSTPIRFGCPMHDLGCLPALYPRPYTSHYSTIHSGYYGQGFQYCPPQWFKDLEDTTPDGSQFGFIELAWRLYLVCSGPTDIKPATWGDIKSLYR